MYSEFTQTENKQRAINIMGLSEFDFKVIKIALQNYKHQLQQIQTENPDVIVTLDFLKQQETCEKISNTIKL